MVTCFGLNMYLLISDSHLSTLLNLLKIFGIFIGGIATVLATVRETKTPDKKHLTQEGHWILALGLLGLLAAFGAQMAEWRSSSLKEMDDAARNHRLLVEIRRSVTRFTDISMDVTVLLSSDLPEMNQYANELESRLDDLDNEDHPVGKVIDGLMVMSRRMGDFPSNSAIKIPVGSDAFPNPAEDKNAALLLSLTVPVIAIFKKAIDPMSYLGIFPTAPVPDMILEASASGRLQGTIFLRDDELSPPDEPALLVSFNRRNIVIPSETWEPSINMDSMQDLNGAHAILILSPLANGEMPLGWKYVTPHITLFINHHRISVNNLRPFRSKDGRESAYVFDFPKNLIPDI